MMKPREDSLVKLRKENFSLKLRINLLEEFVRSFSEDKASLNEINLQKKLIEMEVEMMNLKGDLVDKQKLLSEAASAIDLVEKSYSEKLSELIEENRLLKQQADENVWVQEALSENISSMSEQSSTKTHNPKEREIISLACQKDQEGKQIQDVKEIETSGESDATCAISTYQFTTSHSDVSSLMESHHHLKKEYQKGCLAIHNLVSCVKELAVNNESMRQEMNNTKFLYLHETRKRRVQNELDCAEAEDTQTRNSINSQENQFWWAVVSELVTNKMCGRWS